jgi:hypothetical protein
MIIIIEDQERLLGLSWARHGETVRIEIGFGRRRLRLDLHRPVPRWRTGLWAGQPQHEAADTPPSPILVRVYDQRYRLLHVAHWLPTDEAYARLLSRASVKVPGTGPGPAPGVLELPARSWEYEDGALNVVAYLASLDPSPLPGASYKSWNDFYRLGTTPTPYGTRTLGPPPTPPRGGRPARA